MMFHCTVYRHLLYCDSQVRDGVVAEVEAEVERKTLAGHELRFRREGVNGHRVKGLIVPLSLVSVG